VKKLSNHFPEFRMRAGDWRALFEVAGDRVIVYRILHRKEAYR
jgi:mRNA interferase RelE/StbE